MDLDPGILDRCALLLFQDALGSEMTSERPDPVTMTSYLFQPGWDFWLWVSEPTA